LISLVGLPGSGKSTVGRQLARRLGVPFIDSDHEIEQRIGCSIREFFEREGEDSFRTIEQQVIADLSKPDTATADILATAAGTTQQKVLSTGGGAVLSQLNRDNLRASGHVIYLRSNPDEIFKRLRYDRNRPLLQVGDPLQRLRDLFEVRDPLYREAAHFIVDTGRPSVATLVNMIVMQLELSGATPSSPRDTL
jgi:shikimate kinase